MFVLCKAEPSSHALIPDSFNLDDGLLAWACLTVSSNVPLRRGGGTPKTLDMSAVTYTLRNEVKRTVAFMGQKNWVFLTDLEQSVI